MLSINRRTASANISQHTFYLFLNAGCFQQLNTYINWLQIFFILWVCMLFSQVKKNCVYQRHAWSMGWFGDTENLHIEGSLECSKVYAVANQYVGWEGDLIGWYYWHGRINSRQWCQSTGGVSGVIGSVHQQCMVAPTWPLPQPDAPSASTVILQCGPPLNIQVIVYASYLGPATMPCINSL